MGQPVKISAELLREARETAAVAERSIAGQIEYWAQLGRAIEPLLQGAQALALRKAGKTRPLSECLATVETAEGRRRLAEYLAARPYPHYEPVPGKKGLLLRIEADNRRTVGRFVGREFPRGAMTDFDPFNRRPILFCVAGPNGAGKTTFYHAHLAATGLLLINADQLGADLAIEPYEAARLASVIRRAMTARKESFVFETVFSDPVGEKVAFLEDAAQQYGYEVVLCYIGLDSADQSRQRVALRVSQGGHDVPDDKLRSRFSRTLANLEQAIRRLPLVLVYDNSNLESPYRLVARFNDGKLMESHGPVPKWLRPMMPRKK